MSIGEFIKDKMVVIICNMLIFIVIAAIMAAIKVSLIIILSAFSFIYGIRIYKI